ncbi:MAG: YlbF family regulator [Faecalibacillus sp.]
MNDIINELVDAIKEDQRYIDFKEASISLNDKHVLELLNRYQIVLSDLEYLKQFDSYIDLSDKKKELKQIKKEMAENEIIEDYYEKYYQINQLLDHVTELIFQNISDSLNTTGFQL